LAALILVKDGQQENAYARYTGELLKAEGLNWTSIEEFQRQDAAYLARFRLVVLPHCMLRQPEVDLLVEYVKAGGNLIVFRPSLRLARALGLLPSHRTQKGGYMRIEAGTAVSGGLCTEAIQLHGVAERVALADGCGLDAAAWLCQERKAGVDGPALVVGPLGTGRVAVFLYDLPAAVAGIRQGDPERSNTLSSGLDGIYRPSELFVGHLDPECALIPQADVHTALLANVAEWLVAEPLPRLWYYPKPAQRSVLIMTSDDDWSKVEEFEQLIAATEKRDGRITFYMVPGSHVPRELADDWAARGHAISVHPDFEAIRGRAEAPAQNGLDEQVLHEREMLTASVHGHEQRFGASVRTIRQHSARWQGYMDAARILAELGVRMDFNWVSICPFSATYMIGSGRPAKFVDLDGEILDIFQQSTLYSEDVILAPFIFSLKWPTEKALAHMKGMLDETISTYYTPVGLNSHPVSFATYSAQCVEGLFDMAKERGMPIITGEAWLDFTQARYRAELLDVQTGDGSLRFVLSVDGGCPELTVMWPLGDREVAGVTSDGAAQPVTVEERWGRRYAMLYLAPVKPRQQIAVAFG
jgi:hypothetical protein